MSNIKGIDVSKYQGKINWAKVKADGVKFAMVRVGWCGYNGVITVDSRFHENMQGAIANGIDVGVYLYSYAKTPMAAKIAAEQTLNLIKQYNVTYPVAFDIEDKVNSSMTKAQNNVIAKAYLEDIEKAKYYAMLYTYTNFANCYLDMSQLSQYDVWIADYRGYNGFSGNYGMWQHSSKGRVNGISGNVDLNIAYKDYGSIIRNAGLNKSNVSVKSNTATKPNYRLYTVKSGDSFWKIAHNEMHNPLKMWELAKFNGMKITSMLYPGQKIKIPR